MELDLQGVRAAGTERKGRGRGITGTGLTMAPQGVLKKILRPGAAQDYGGFGQAGKAADLAALPPRPPSSRSPGADSPSPGGDQSPSRSQDDIGLSLRRALSHVSSAHLRSDPPRPYEGAGSESLPSAVLKQRLSAVSADGRKGSSVSEKTDRRPRNVGSLPPKQSRSKGSSRPATSDEGTPARRASRSEKEKSAPLFGGSDEDAISPFGWSASLALPSQKKEAKSSRLNLLASVFLSRPPVLFFDYEPFCGASARDPGRILAEEDTKAIGLTAAPKMYFVIHTTKDVHEYHAVVNTLKHAGLHKAPVGSTKFCIYWGPHPSPELLRSLNPFQKVNHFPASWHLGRKDLLGKNVQRMKRQFPKDFNIMPAHFTLPDDAQSWAQAREQQPSALWIWKPVNLSCGKGIRLFSAHVPAATEKKLASKPGVVQRYMDRPLLINGYKFDLRLYVVVTSFDPLKVYLNSEGLVRLATEKYDCSPDSLKNRMMHLTNYSVNKHAAGYKQNLDGAPAVESTARSPSPEAEAGAGEDASDNEADSDAGQEGEDVPEAEEQGEPGDGAEETEAQSKAEEQASKWSLRQLQDYLTANGKDYKLAMARIEDLIIKTLISAEPQIVNMWQQGANFSTASPTPIQQVGSNQTCFEIFGFDVMLDDQLLPWLLEVNTFPSFSSSSPYDKRIKTQLVSDVFTLLGISPFDNDAVEKAVKEEQAKRLQGLPKSLTVVRTHTNASIKTATLRSFGEAEWRLILDTHDEHMRRGNLRRIFPKQGTEIYQQFLSSPRYSNLVLDRWIELGGERCFLPDARDQLPLGIPPQVCFAPV
mmetsp:Transcript_81218/g.143219  ORF Transcript_81218/g.143219 Transcript_81218/m.143219 type:complete len:816 (+) Transcript_81218:109-2556(+)